MALPPNNLPKTLFRIPAPKKPFSKPTVVLFFGGGQDSTALLYQYHYDAEFRKRYAGDAHFLVIMADTGNEFPYTYTHVAEVKAWCVSVGIEFYFVTADMGFHGATWQSLQGQFERNNTIMGVAYHKTCTDNLKIKVCYRFLAEWLRTKYGFTKPRMDVFYQYKAFYGQMKTWIGFAAGEESRVSVRKLADPGPGDELLLFGDCQTTIDSYIPKWRQLTVTHLYPLIDLGFSRQSCQLAIAGYGHTVPFPSNCMLCPYQNEIEILYLYSKHRTMWNYWLIREAAKLTKFAYAKVNYGVKGKLTLEAFLEKAQAKFGHMTMEEIEEYRFSHGHCVKSKI